MSVLLQGFLQYLHDKEHTWKEGSIESLFVTRSLYQHFPSNFSYYRSAGTQAEPQ
jgi:hypothetical protein